MAGLLPHQLSRELTPEEATTLAPHGPLIDLLARYLAQTQAQPFGKQERQPDGQQPMPMPSPTAMVVMMRKMKGPVEANRAKQYANMRDRLIKQIED